MPSIRDFEPWIGKGVARDHLNHLIALLGDQDFPTWHALFHDLIRTEYWFYVVTATAMLVPDHRELVSQLAVMNGDNYRASLWFQRYHRAQALHTRAECAMHLAIHAARDDPGAKEFILSMCVEAL